MGTMLKYGSEGAKQFYDNVCHPDRRSRKAHATATFTSTTWIF